MYVCMYVTEGSKQKSTSNPGPPHKQNYILPARLPSSRITTREPTHKQNYDQGTGWLAGWRNYERLAGWLAGGLAGWLAG